jgi:hypothetical protein
MSKHAKILLTIDAIVNLLLGLILLLFPLGIADLLGAPEAGNGFYATLLGAVLFGIGLALLLERFGYKRGFRGLALGGAFIINVLASGVLLLWLLFAAPDIPLRGAIILWVIGVAVFGLGIIELVAQPWKS